MILFSWVWIQLFPPKAAKLHCIALAHIKYIW